MKCWGCGKAGHIRRNCLDKEKSSSSAAAATEDSDDEEIGVAFILEDDCDNEVPDL